MTTYTSNKLNCKSLSFILYHTLMKYKYFKDDKGDKHTNQKCFPFLFLSTSMLSNFFKFHIKYYTFTHRRPGPVSFRGTEISCPNIFSITCLKIKWFCRILHAFLPENGYLKNSKGLPASYAYAITSLWHSVIFSLYFYICTQRN